MKFKSLLIAAILSSAIAVAHGNSKFPKPDYKLTLSTDRFSVNFVNLQKFEVDGPRCDDDPDFGTGKELCRAYFVSYLSRDDKETMQWLSIRIVDHDIPVTQAAADFYAGKAATEDTVKDSEGSVYNVAGRLKGEWHGLPYTYFGEKYVDGKVEKFNRSWVIVADKRTVISLHQSTRFTLDDGVAWKALGDSLVIK